LAHSRRGHGRIADALDHIRKVKLLTPRQARRLQSCGRAGAEGGLPGPNPNGLFKL